VYLVMDADPGDPVEFRAHGRVELWDPWTGDVRPLRVVSETATGTCVELPLQPYEAQLVVFTPGEEHIDPPPSAARRVLAKTLPDDWRVSFEPTMDNRHGDFRLPVTPANRTIGVEARRFAWARETADLAKTAMLPETDDGSWRTQLHGYGHQGPHGLKGTISDHFIRLGAFTEKRSGVYLLTPEAHSRYYLWTSATVSEPTIANIQASRPAPADMPNTSPVSAPVAVFVNGERLGDLSQALSLDPGTVALELVRHTWDAAAP